MIDQKDFNQYFEMFKTSINITNWDVLNIRFEILERYFAAIFCLIIIQLTLKWK